MLLRVLILTIFFQSVSYALEFKTQYEKKKNSISVLGISSSFTTEEGAISGSGLGVDFGHAFNDKTTFEISLSTALSQGKGVASSFTGLSGFVYYNFFAGCCDKFKTVLISGVPIYEETLLDPYLLQLGIGVNQYFLNGSKGVYSSSGLGLGANFLFRAWDFRVKLSARASKMTSNETEVTGIFLGAGLIFPL